MYFAVHPLILGMSTGDVLVLSPILILGFQRGYMWLKTLWNGLQKMVFPYGSILRVHALYNRYIVCRGVS